jgi:AraC-like DNA-binding protein
MANATSQFEGRIRRQRGGERQALHRHDEPRLVIFLAGEMREEAFEGERRFRCGEFVFRPAFFAHANIVDEGNSAYSHLNVSDGAVRKWIARHGWRAGTGKVDLDGLLHGDEVLDRAEPQPYARVALASEMQHVAALLCTEAPAPLADIATFFGLLPHELTRRFYRAYGRTPTVYRRQARLQRAIRMLAETTGSLSQIAQAAGFFDQSHLTHEVKRETGLTPSALLPF